MIAGASTMLDTPFMEPRLDSSGSIMKTVLTILSSDSQGNTGAARARATAWAAVYSFQFELGPFSEASIGNVGLRANTAGSVDHVVTPTRRSSHS